MEKIEQQLQEIKQLIELGDISNTAVSKVGSYWQLDHSLRVINGIPKAIENSNPKEYAPSFNLKKLLIMTFKKIPRGKGRAPKNVLPTEAITKDGLLIQLENATSGLHILNQLEPKCHFKHPYFGHLNVKESKKFLSIHTEHHLKIVRDIMKKN